MIGVLTTMFLGLLFSAHRVDVDLTPDQVPMRRRLPQLKPPQDSARNTTSHRARRDARVARHDPKGVPMGW